MPKAPITSRTLYWERLDDGTIHVLDWNLVAHQTLGAMVESRNITRIGPTKNEDLYDSSYTEIAVAPPLPSGNYAFDQAIFGGSTQWPHFRADDPGVT